MLNKRFDVYFIILEKSYILTKKPIQIRMRFFCSWTGSAVGDGARLHFRLHSSLQAVRLRARYGKVMIFLHEQLFILLQC